MSEEEKSSFSKIRNAFDRPALAEIGRRLLAEKGRLEDQDLAYHR
jgi:hypothetical protein